MCPGSLSERSLPRCVSQTHRFHIDEGGKDFFGKDSLNRSSTILKRQSQSSHTFEARVTRFTGALNPATRTMRTEIDIPNRRDILKPGMYGKVTLILEERSQAITLPAGAVHTEGDKRFAYSVVEGRLRKIEVETGLDDGIIVEITEGLEGHETVVLASRGEIVEGMAVEVYRAPASQ